MSGVKGSILQNLISKGNAYKDMWKEPKSSNIQLGVYLDITRKSRSINLMHSFEAGLYRTVVQLM